jgi:hypothetical protein
MTLIELQLTLSYSKFMQELSFEVTQELDGGYVAEALGESIFTQASTWNELQFNIKEAVEAFYFDSSTAVSVRFIFNSAQ